MLKGALLGEQKRVAFHKQITQTVNIQQWRGKSPQSLDSCTAVINEKERKSFRSENMPGSAPVH